MATLISIIMCSLGLPIEFEAFVVFPHSCLQWPAAGEHMFYTCDELGTLSGGQRGAERLLVGGTVPIIINTLHYTMLRHTTIICTVLTSLQHNQLHYTLLWPTTTCAGTLAWGGYISQQATLNTTCADTCTPRVYYV